MTLNNKKPKLLLHTCCAICGAYITQILIHKFDPIIFFYNPNIHPAEEYEKRKRSAKKLAEIYNLAFIEGSYEPEKWFEKITGLEKEPEGGARCPLCFALRLQATAQAAKEKNIEIFTTTLAVSPYKNEKVIDLIGKKIADDLSLQFIRSSDLDLSKKEIWQRSREIARDYGCYHQKYCGCTFSMQKK